jgi:hypothetical protein
LSDDGQAHPDQATLDAPFERPLPPGITAVADARARVRARFEGDVRRIRIHSLAAVPTLEVQLDDGTGRISALFMGRRGISGIECGRRLAIEGTPVAGERGLTLYNPAYDLR